MGGTQAAAGRDGTAANPRPPSRAQLGQAAAVAAALTLLWRLVSPLAQPLCCDAAEYLKMAAHPSRAVARQYATRVLLPWVVHLLGGSAAVYHLLALCCLALAAVAVYLLCRQVGADHRWALLGMAALVCSRGWVFLFFDPYLSDPAAFLLLAVALLLAARRRPGWPLAISLLLLAAARELFVGVALPLYARLRRRAARLRAALHTLALLLPGVVVFLLLVRFTASVRPGVLAKPPAAILGEVIATRMRQDGLLWPLSPLVMSLGVWWPLAVAGHLGNPRLRWSAWWLLPVFANFLLGWDWARYAMYAFPVVIPAGVLALSQARHRAVLLVLVGMQASLSLLDVLLGRLTLNYPGPSLPLGSLLLAATAATLALDRPRPAPGAEPATTGTASGGEAP